MTSPLTPLPKDLAHPRREIASLAANIITGVCLLVITGLLLAFWMLSPGYDMDPDEQEPNVGLGPSALTLDEFRLAFHQVHEQLGLDDPL